MRLDKPKKNDYDDDDDSYDDDYEDYDDDWKFKVLI